jgi:Tol biopolymer transport system component
MMTRKLLLSTSWLLLAMLAACGTPTPTPASLPTQRPAVAHTPTRTARPTKTLYPTWTPRPTATRTLIPTLGPTATPNLTPALTGRDTDRIVFVSWDRISEKGYDIYLVKLDGSDPVRLTDDPARDSFPAWSPDGKKIVFVSNRDGNQDIFVLNPDGSGQTNLTPHEKPDKHPVWSPDGTRIAFESQRDGRSEIYVMNADGSDQRRLTDNGRNNEEPEWSPDGSRIAFASRPIGDSVCQVHVMDADGTNQTQLTAEGTRCSPTWSPDGTKIASISDIEIFVMNADGSGPRQLVHAQGQVHYPTVAWSPDSTRLAFIDTLPESELWVVNVQSGAKTRLAEEAILDSPPAWSPDGTKIVYGSQGSNTSSPGLYVMNADGSNPTRLNSDVDFKMRPAWMPPPTLPVVAHPDCTGGWTRLTAGGRARVSDQTATPNRVRSGPSSAEPITALLHPGNALKVLEGPICADGLVFWKIQDPIIPGGIGWTAEGDGSEYWLEPYEP